LRRLRDDLRRRAAVVRARPHGDADPAQRAGGQGDRRVGDDRRRPRRPERRRRRPRPPRGAPRRNARHPAAGVDGTAGGPPMIPAAFEYRRAASVDEAVALLAEGGEDAKLLAGGHSLLPLMKVRLARPSLLVDIGRAAGMRRIDERDGTLAIGALARHQDLATSDLLRARCPLLALGADEVLVEILVPVPAAGHGWSYQKFTRRAIDWAIVGVAAVVEPSPEGIARAAVGLVNMGPTPLRAAAVEAALRGAPRTAVAAAAARAPEGTEPAADIHADAEFRAHLATVLTRRALEEALSRC